MADVDNRRDYRGGGGGRGFNKRKRFREDDEFDAQPYRNQRQRHEAPPGTRIKRGLLEIGEDGLRLPHEVAMHLAKLTAENYEDEYVKETFSTVTLRLVVEQPLKIPFVAGVVLFAHAEKKEIAADVVSRAGPLLQEHIDKGEWREFKLMLRFVACLGRLFEEDGVLPVLDELFNRAVDLQTASQEDVVGLELVKIILLTIPYLLASTDDVSLQQKAAELLEKTDIVASTPHQLEPLVDPYPPPSDENEKVMACASIISLLQRQLQDEATNGWPLTCIPRVFDPSLKTSSITNGDANGETNGDSSSTKLTFPSINVPSPINPGPKPLFPELYFSLYADQDLESVPPTTSIASTLIRDTIVDTINILDFNRLTTARFLNDLDSFWSPNTFAKRGTTFDKLRELPEGRSTWKPEDVAIDAIFSQILVLPTPEHRLVYYHSIITESCKISPQNVAPSLGRAIRFLFRGVESMDLELGYRYMDWFAHHLSNFEFRWKWAEWIPDLDLPDLHPKKSFIAGTLDKEIRLSFSKRIRATLPDQFHPLIPESKDKDTPDFKFADDNTPFAREGREVEALLRRKAPEEEIQRVLDSVHAQAAALLIPDPLTSSTDVYMTAILSIGSKSLSHVLSTIDRCKERLLAIGLQSEPAKRQIIKSVFDFWTLHPGTAVNIVDKLLNYTIVTPMDVVQFALQDMLDSGRALALPHIYELISITMFKVTNRVHQLLAHRNNTAVPFADRKQVDAVFPRERESMRELFTAIEDAVAGVAAGAQDEMIEGFEGHEAAVARLRDWGARWARVWRRKAAVEEGVVGDGMLVPLVEEEAVVGGAEGDAVEDMDRIE